MTPAVPPPGNLVRDTLGAGDTFNGVVISHLVQQRLQNRELPIASSVGYACHVTGYKVGFYGYACLRDQAGSIKMFGL